ncbi:homocysteine S-methyltransferase family protein [Pelagibacterales bacterium SAG-MED48]|nr:homocysteine S-methyltransferase family protein [Pelagibacterales bacterium SAG-MED48]
MTYNLIKQRLENNDTIILDGAIGAELEKKGAKMHKDLWCGTCSVESPDLVKKVHEEYILAGADIITTNTYATTPIGMKQYGFEDQINEFNKKSVQIAKDAVKNSNKDIAVAGSVSTFGSLYKFGTEAMKPGFKEQLKILSGEGVDLIILEAMSSQADIVETIIECSQESKLPVWLSISCIIDDKTNKVMLGYNDTIDSDTNIYEDFETSINNFSKIHKGPILIAHSDIEVTGQAVKIAKKKFNGVLGAYPNRGHYEKPHWKFVDNITPSEYLEKARSWVEDGAQIVGGCCGVGVEEIKAISKLKKNQNV